MTSEAMFATTRRLLSVLATAAAASSSGCSSTDSQSNGCAVSFANVNAAGATILTTSFHDGTSNALFWNPMLKHLDVLGGDVSDKPARAFELELFGQPIADGATVILGVPDAASPLMPTSRLSFTAAGIEELRSNAGAVHFTTASSTRLVYTVDNATMVTLDSAGNPKSDGPSLTISMKCALDAKAD
jgi:hypothetical protein